MTTNEQRFHRAAAEFAQRIVELVVETKDDLPFDDQAVIYSICADTVNGYDLNLLVLAKVREILGLK